MKGERAETIPVAEVDWTTTEFDWQQLQRWGINERLFPEQHGPVSSAERLGIVQGCTSWVGC